MIKKIVSIAGLLLAPAFVFAQGTVSLTPPTNSTTICGFLKDILQSILILGIPVAVLFLVYAGFLFVWARGNPKRLTDARKNLFYVILGIGIFIGAWLMGQVIANTLNALAVGAGQPNPQIGSCR